MKSSFCIDLQRFMLIPTKFPLIPFESRGLNWIIMRNLIQQCYCLGGIHPLDDEKFYELIVKSCNKKLDMQDFIDALKDKKDDFEIDDIYRRYEDLLGFYAYLKGHNINL